MESRDRVLMFDLGLFWGVVISYIDFVDACDDQVEFRTHAQIHCCYGPAIAVDSARSRGVGCV